MSFLFTCHRCRDVKGRKCQKNSVILTRNKGFQFSFEAVKVGKPPTVLLEYTPDPQLFMLMYQKSGQHESEQNKVTNVISVVLPRNKPACLC